jgi:hypothetical protein
MHLVLPSTNPLLISLGRTRSCKLKNPRASKKIAPLAVVSNDTIEIKSNENRKSTDTIAKPKMKMNYTMSTLSLNKAIETISSQPGHTHCVTFNEHVEIKYYDNLNELIDRSKLHYTSHDYKIFEVEADMEETRCKLKETISSLQKRTRSGGAISIEGNESRKREELLRKVASQYCLDIR